MRWWRCQLDMQVVVTEQLQEGHLCEARCLSVAPELTHSRGCWNCLPVCRVKAVTKADFSGRTTWGHNVVVQPSFLCQFWSCCPHSSDIVPSAASTWIPPAAVTPQATVGIAGNFFYYAMITHTHTHTHTHTYAHLYYLMFIDNYNVHMLIYTSSLNRSNIASAIQTCSI